MIKLAITPELIEQAEIRAAKIGKLRNSIRSGEGNLVGAIGEVLVANYVGVDLTESFEHDLISDGLKVDVKSKERSVPPQPYFNCSVPAYNTTQQCDHYVFVSVLNDHSAGWIVGGITKTRFFEEAKFHCKGDIDPSSTRGWTFKADCYDLPISQLDTWPDDI